MDHVRGFPDTELMLVTPEEIAAALADTSLAGAPVHAHPNGLVLVDVSSPDQVLSAWQAARARLSVTGRWPVAIAPDWNHFDHYPRPSAADLSALDVSARTADPWPELERWLHDRSVTVDDLGDCLIESGATDLGLQSRGRFELTFPTTSLAVERWILDQVAADPALADLVEQSSDVPYLVGTQQWFTPDALQIALLPTGSPWHAPAWLDFFETSPQDLAAVLRQWQDTYGAELVACWGTMLQFVVHRPPAPGAQAWELARRQMSLGPSLQTPLWMLARALPRSDAWFVHSRP